MSDWGAWRRIAADYWGRFWTQPGTFFTTESPWIEVEVDEVLIRAGIDRDAPMHQGATVTRIETRFLLGRGPTFSITGAPCWERRVHSPDLVLGGHAKFDDKFEVRGENLVDLRALMSPQLRHALSLNDDALYSDGRTIEIATHETDHDVDRLRELLVIAADIAKFPKPALEALRSVPGATYMPPEGGWDARTPPRAILELPERVEVGPAIHEQAATMVARVRLGQPIDPTTQPAFDPTLGTVRLDIADRELCLRWLVWPTKAQVLEEGAKLIAQLARPGGPYR